MFPRSLPHDDSVGKTRTTNTTPELHREAACWLSSDETEETSILPFIMYIIISGFSYRCHPETQTQVRILNAQFVWCNTVCQSGWLYSSEKGLCDRFFVPLVSKHCTVLCRNRQDIHLPWHASHSVSLYMFPRLNL